MHAATAESSRIVQIQVIGAPKFDVIYHRALTNATGAVIAGLIGAGIQSGIESGKDSKKRDAIQPFVAEHVWDDAFIKTFNESLLAKGLTPIWVGDKSDTKRESADVYVLLEPETYGFRMVDTNTALVSAYVEFNAAFTRERPRSRSKAPKESFYLTHNRQASYEEILQQGSQLNAEVEAVLTQAARRLANKIAYNIN